MEVLVLVVVVEEVVVEVVVDVVVDVVVVVVAFNLINHIIFKIHKSIDFFIEVCFYDY